MLLRQDVCHAARMSACEWHPLGVTDGVALLQRLLCRLAPALNALAIVRAGA
ncbi:MAG TPA: hypothetical protein VGO93_19255 [Candidatus Xenobia bacterium]